MRNCFSLVLLLNMFIFQISTLESKQIPIRPNSNYITYSGGSRFGDRLINYMRAKAHSIEYNIPLLYVPFKYSDELVLHTEDIHINNCSRRLAVRPLKNSEELKLPDQNWLFNMRFFAESPYEYKLLPFQKAYFESKWDDPEIKAELKRLVSPRNELKLIDFPKDKISVALHIRTGIGVDGAAERSVFPLKFPPMTYYIEQLKKINELLHERDLYVFVFTDAPNPEEMVSDLKKTFAEYKNIEFDYRKQDNGHSTNVLEDFFSMAKFHCLIRAQSHFSIAASKIADYLIQIEPASLKWEGRGKKTKIIDTVNITLSEEYHQGSW